MISLHGWAIVSESFREEDESEVALTRAVNQIQQKVYSIVGTPEEQVTEPLAPWEADHRNRYNRRGNTLINFTVLNGTYHLSDMADWNRKDGKWKEVYDLFELIASVAPGSYGLLYVRDDEDKHGGENIMQVYVLKKGTFLEAADSHLSPCFNEIEEL